jgi:hypothetical protein
MHADHFPTLRRQLFDRLLQELILSLRVCGRILGEVSLSHAEQSQHPAGMRLVKQVQPEPVVIGIQRDTQLTEELLRQRNEFLADHQDHLHPCSVALRRALVSCCCGKL